MSRVVYQFFIPYLMFFIPYLMLWLMFGRLKQITTPEGYQFIKTTGIVFLVVTGLNFAAVIIASMLRHYVLYGWI